MNTQSHDSNVQSISKDGQTMVTKWITVIMNRRPDCGGGTMEGDLPDTAYHRHYYGDKIVRAWTQSVSVS